MRKPLGLTLVEGAEGSVAVEEVRGQVIVPLSVPCAIETTVGSHGCSCHSWSNTILAQQRRCAVIDAGKGRRQCRQAWWSHQSG